MMDGSVQVEKTRSSYLEALRIAEMLAAVRRFGAMLASLMVAAFVAVRRRGVRARTAIVARISSFRLPVAHGRYAQLEEGIVGVETRSIKLALCIEDRDIRAQALLDLARLAHAIGRDPDASLRVLVDELRDDRRWTCRQERVFLATRLCCSAAGLGAMHARHSASRDAYLLGQTYYGKLQDVDRKIGIALAFSDAAALMGSVGDQASWLDTAMDLAGGITDRERRLEAVRHVATKMVVVRIPPATGVNRDRFDVVAEPLDRPAADEDPQHLGSDDLEFDTI